MLILLAVFNPWIEYKISFNLILKKIKIFFNMNM